MEKHAIIFEILMVLAFGISWPFNNIKAYKARTARGTSLFFIWLIGIGYTCGILSKIFSMIEYGPSYNTPLRILAFSFYIFNLIMVFCGMLIYFRNKKLDKNFVKN